jgi:hypothetical protein
MARLNWHPPEIPSMKAVFYNLDPASVFAHEGFTRKDDSEAPDRPFITYGAEGVNIKDTIKDNYNNQPHVGGVARAFEATAQIIHDEIMELITEDVWEWDRTTKRKSGEIVDSPRNIVDLGGIRDGQRFEVFEVER